ncbi:hypothetical protein GCM10010201_09610 [Pilimelia columellifera subsp. columellifera]|uniref:DUF5679 domain-containing protein n=1 Tax=Pilimelia columellifera subsp. columellifera TaxID=706583 RepID=A0ABN3N6H0_9ACTN
MDDKDRHTHRAELPAGSGHEIAPGWVQVGAGRRSCTAIAPAAARHRRIRATGAATTGRRQHEEDTVAQTYEGYCVKCKEKRTFEGNVEVSKTGMEMAKGKCPTCGTTVNRILGKAKAKA